MNVCITARRVFPSGALSRKKVSVVIPKESAEKLRVGSRIFYQKKLCEIVDMTDMYSVYDILSKEPEYVD